MPTIVSGEPNFAGYSYGSVVAAHAPLRLAESGERVDTLLLIGTPISPDSDLYQSLLTNDNIGTVVRIDIEGDPFSAGINADEVYEMERHFYFIDNNEGQQDWLGSLAASAIRHTEQCRERQNCPDEIVVMAEPPGDTGDSESDRPNNTQHDAGRPMRISTRKVAAVASVVVGLTISLLHAGTVFGLFLYAGLGMNQELAAFTVNVAAQPGAAIRVATHAPAGSQWVINGFFWAVVPGGLAYGVLTWRLRALEKESEHP